MKTTDTLGSRIKARLAELETKPQWLADEVAKAFPGSNFDVKTACALIERKSKRSMYAAQIAHVLGVSHTWLTDGAMPKLVGSGGAETEKIKTLEPLSDRQKNISAITSILEVVSDEGIYVAIGSLREIAKSYPLQIKQRLSS